MKMLKVDFGQLEARVIAMASKDKVLCRQTWDDYDIHSDWTARLAEDLELRDVLKKLGKDNPAYKAFRDNIKNSWTFPLLFGSAPTSVAQNLAPEPGRTWEWKRNKKTGKMEEAAMSWLLDRVDLFWNQYAGVRKWQRSTKEFYDINGYVQTLTGFRRRGPLSWNELINMPIQGTASDIVIDSMNRLSEIAEEEKLPELQPVLNVHDELCFYLPKTRLDDYVSVIACEMCMCKFPFITVPLSVEVSVGDNWHEQEEVGVFNSKNWGHTQQVSISQALISQAHKGV
jgi:hypothetical protein